MAPAIAILLAVLSASLGLPNGFVPAVAFVTSAGEGTYSGILLALGDSLAAGYQPTYGDEPPPVSAETGKPDQGYPGNYAAHIAEAHHLLLVDLACPGETTSSMTGVPAAPACRSGYELALHASSQLAAAEAFIAAETVKIKLVTFDLGANDVDDCVSASTGISISCTLRAEADITDQLPPILAALRRAIALHDPRALLVGMNYYDPFLAGEYSPGGLVGAAEATQSLSEVATVNGLLATAFRKAHMPVANVAVAFKTGTAVPEVTYHGHRLALDVDDICRWTWMCPLRGSTQPANIHANSAGYAVIAGAFEAVLPPDLP